MRKGRFGRLLAGTALTLIVATPTVGVSAPDRVESVLPPPPMLNGQRTIRRQAAPVPPPPAPALQQRTTIKRDAAPAPVPAAGAPRPADPDFGIKDTLNKIVAASDSQIGEKLRAIITSKQLDKRIARAGERKAIEAFYAARNYAPLWLQNGAPTERAKAVMARLKNAGADGLDPADYPVPGFGAGAEADADGELTLTNSALDFARHLATGRVAPTRVLVEVDYGDHTPPPDEVLRKLADSRDVNATFNSFDPPAAGFRTLKAKLAELRAQAGEADAGRVPGGPAIKPGAKDARIPLLRERLRVKGKAGDTTYDRALYNAIRQVQRDASINPSGVIDNKTLAVLNGPSRNDIIDRVLANMERWRWLPRELGRTYVMVNIPDFTLKLVNGGDTIWRTKVVVGKPQTLTPLLSAPMDQVIVNPSWYVPQSIIQNELLPAYETDKNIFKRLGLEVKRGSDGNINVVQPPGAANALGRIKFPFPNKFQIYLHDTPEKQLFTYNRRAFSHGCIRVQDPTRFGELILSLAMSGPTPNSRQLNSMVGQPEKSFKLANRPMVHVTYQTVFVDDAGTLQLRDDIYGFDARIRAIVNSDERRIADVPPPPDPKRDHADQKANQEILRRVERREAANPFAFFEQLFR